MRKMTTGWDAHIWLAVSVLPEAFFRGVSSKSDS